MELKQHPLSAAFPAMSADDFQALKDDIENNGQREPVTLLDGMVLDGWHRYQACVQLGIKPQQFTFDKDKDPVAFVLSENLHRRHLTPSQRAAAVVACSEYGSHGGNRKGQKDQGAKLPLDRPAAKVDELAKAAQVAPRLIKDAAVAKKGGLLDEVKDGTISASKAAEIVRGKPSQKPVKASKRELPQAAESDPTDDLAEAQHTITDLATENEQLRDRIAVEAMEASEEEKTQAAETIRELRSLVKTLEAELSAVKVSRDTYMREATEAKKDAIYWRNKAKKAGAEA